jgi:hypothetical protein
MDCPECDKYGSIISVLYDGTDTDAPFVELQYRCDNGHVFTRIRVADFEEVKRYGHTVKTVYVNNF